MSISAFLEKYSAQQLSRVGACKISMIHNCGAPVVFDEHDSVVTEFCEKLSRLIAGSFGTYPDDESAHIHINLAEYIAIAHRDDTLLGFATGIVLPRHQLYLREVAVDTVTKGLGLTQSFILHLTEVSDCDDVIFITQNQVMYRILEKLYNSVYPSVAGEVIPDTVKSNMEDFMSRYRDRDCTLIPEQGVVKRFFSKSLYKERPLCGIQTVDDWFETALGIENGHTCDTFCFVGKSQRR